MNNVRFPGIVHPRHPAPPKNTPPKSLSTKQIYQDSQVRVVSDQNLPVADAQKLATKVEAAYAFARKQNGFDASQNGISNPVTVAALSAAGFAAVGGTPGIAGMTINKDTFIVPASVIDSTNPDDLDTFAHELDHVQDFRAAGASFQRIPTYIEEGKAYSIGNAYPIALGKAGTDQALRDVTVEVASVTRAQAQSTISRFRSPKSEDGKNGFQNETTGALFVQWLNSRVKKGAVALLASAVAATGKGASFPDTFQKQFGMSLSNAEKQFVDFVGQTEGNPQARLAGTIWAPLLKDFK